MPRRDKLDSSAKFLLSQALSADEDEQKAVVSVFLRGSRAFSPNDVAALEADGARVRTVAGDVLTADVPLDAIERVSEHDFVLAVQASQALFPEDPDQKMDDVE